FRRTRIDHVVETPQAQPQESFVDVRSRHCRRRNTSAGVHDSDTVIGRCDLVDVIAVGSSMGIFSRIFQRGQDGDPANAASREGDGTVMNDEPEINHSGTAAPPAPAAATPVAEPPVPLPPKLPGLTPAFAAASTSVPHTPVESGRSIWEWQGPPPRRSG